VGTASLVFGLILIGIGLYLVFLILGINPTGSSEAMQLLTGFVIGILVLATPFFVVGGLLLRKYDRDRKKWFSVLEEKLI